MQIHFPVSEEKLRIAQKRFAFQEMLLVQLKSLQTKSQWESQNSLKIKFNEELIKNFVSDLPFKLTGAQRKSSFEILKDLEKTRPMNRLLNGDVGSGKTIVAAISALQVMQADHQVALMAPTEVLARQHFENLCKIFAKYNFNLALLTNSYKETRKKSKSRTQSRKMLLSEIRAGKINLIIGTHALIQKDVRFKNLALVIVDEQHRFGVAQRAYLQQDTMQMEDGLKKSVPHLLTMTATPIPRTLAIAFSGNLDISLLDEMPQSRKGIITQIISPQKRNSAYEFIRNQIKIGRQIFIILPLVEESKVLTEVKAAVQEHARLVKEVFPEYQLGLLHGKLKSKEKEAVMQDFKSKKTNILVSTSVVEVGIDIPNASVILIEDADRFGLSQLHQVRGRVGRSKHQSFCFLFTNSNSEKSIGRLKALEESNDGFEIAQKDLELRGPGHFFGTLQSGLPDIAMENLTNIKLIKFARAEAEEILKHDLNLEKHSLLKSALQKFQEKIHLE
jgi:ATP-dependent DNA helicase RecG